MAAASPRARPPALKPREPAPPSVTGTTGVSLGLSEDKVGEETESVVGADADETCDDEGTVALEECELGPGVIRGRLELTVPVV